MLMYTRPATTHTPALIIYLINASVSMNELCGTTTKIDLVNRALYETIQMMVQKSLRETKVLARYKIALFAYNNATVIDVLDGIRDLSDLVWAGGPIITPGGDTTDAARGFVAVEQLLNICSAEFQHCPAPLICHVSDTPLLQQNSSAIMRVVRSIRSIHVDDGPLLVENVYIAENALQKVVPDWQLWGGVLQETNLADDNAKLLYRLSSPLPAKYRQNMNEYGYHLREGAAFFFPGLHTELVSMAFAASTAVSIK
jgi:hypothetical protein